VREVFKSEAIGGAKSYLPNLGDLAFRALSVGKPDGLIDGHPQSSKVDLFEAYVQNVLDALEAKPRLKAETAVFITWDEAGGYWIPASSADRKRAQLFGATITCCRHGSFIAASTYSAVCRKRRSFGAFRR
jgi:Phosphoesterase family